LTTWGNQAFGVFADGRHSNRRTRTSALQEMGLSTAIMSYNEHRALILRPDDVWLAILTQFNFFVNANAEALRSQFVSHDGQKELTVTIAGSQYTADYGHMADAMTKEIEKNLPSTLGFYQILPLRRPTTQSYARSS
jgi:hypothetical protein